MPSYSYILRDVPEAAQPATAALLGRVFNLKDTTCINIAQSAPIVLLTDLERDEAAVLVVLLQCLTRAKAVTEIVEGYPEDLGKIDWPRRPQIFRRDFAEHIADFEFIPPGMQVSLVAMAAVTLPGVQAVLPTPAAMSPAPLPGTRPQLKSMTMPEITPFGGMAVLPSGPSNSGTRTVARPPTGRFSPPGEASDDPISRLNELFPDDESSGFVPNNQDITSILNKLLPDEDDGSAPERRTPVTNTPMGGNGAIGHAVFLAKIVDEGRRQKAVPLIAELAKITAEEAEILSKKVIIPVLKGVTKDEAENAKVRFAKIGILARVKGPDA